MNAILSNAAHFPFPLSRAPCPLLLLLGCQDHERVDSRSTYKEQETRDKGQGKREASMKRWLLAVLFGVLASAVAGPNAQTRVTVLEGGTLIDGTGQAPVTDAIVI